MLIFLSSSVKMQLMCSPASLAVMMPHWSPVAFKIDCFDVVGRAFKESHEKGQKQQCVCRRAHWLLMKTDGFKICSHIVSFQKLEIHHHIHACSATALKPPTAEPNLTAEQCSAGKPWSCDSCACSLTHKTPQQDHKNYEELKGSTSSLFDQT